MCEHKYVHLDTSRNCESQRHGYNKQWKRIDRFFCEKCLEIETKIRTACEMDEPEWY